MRRTRSPVTAKVRGLSLLCLCALSLHWVAPPGVRGKTFKLLVLHTNDMHSHFDQIDDSGMARGRHGALGAAAAAAAADACRDGHCARPAGDRCFGGFARLLTAVRRERASAFKDPGVHGALFLNAGDTSQGTAFYTVFKWRVVAELLPELGIDAMCLGNHEFDDGVKDTTEYLQRISTPVVGCNINVSAEPLFKSVNNFKKSIIITVNGRRIGIIGYLTQETAMLSNVGQLQFEDEIESIRKEANHLKSQGVNIIIAVGHSGFDKDREIAREVEEVDLVVGGHTNTFLYSGKPPDVEKPSGAYPFCVKKRNSEDTVPVVQAFHATKYLGKLWLEFDDQGVLINSYGNPILLDSSIPQDPRLLTQVKGLKEKFYNETKKTIGRTKVDLEGYSNYCRFRECNFGNFVTDAYIQYNKRMYTDAYDSQNTWTDAPIAIQPGGGIRNDISHLDHGGNITYGQLLVALPFKNNIGKAQMFGSDLLKAVEHSYARYDGISPHGEFLQVSGLKVEIDLGKPRNSRVRSILVRSKQHGKTEYMPINEKHTYTVILSEFLWKGGDGYRFGKNFNFQSFDKSDFDIVQEEIIRTSPISPTVDEKNKRIKLHNIDQIKRTASPESILMPSEFEHSNCGRYENKPKNYNVINN